MTSDAAARAEATAGDTIDFTYQGFKMTGLPATVDDWDAEALELMERGRAMMALRAIIGSAQYEALKAHLTVDGVPPKVRDYSALMDALAAEYGFGDSGK